MSKLRLGKRIPGLRGLLGTFLAVGFLLPILYTAVSAFKPVEEIFAVPMRWIPSRIVLSNFVEPLIYGRFAR